VARTPELKNSNKHERPINTSEFRIHGDIELLSGSFTTRSFAPHFHDRYSLILVEQGAGDYSYKDHDYLVEGGRLLILNPYDVHTGRAIKGSQWKFRSMYLPIELMESHTKVEGKIDSLSWKDRIVKQPQIVHRFAALHDRLLKEEEDISLESQFLDFITELRKVSFEALPSNAADKNTPLIAIQDYLHAHYAEQVQLTDLERVSGWTKFHLIHRFTKRYGLSPHKYLLNLRIAAAKRLLRKRISATEVAYQTGFFDQSHFIKTFKGMTGITPKAYG
jgi:AraC-like DNA-binding protein